MSSQKGNATRSRPQKHQNRFAFKNNLHDTNVRTKRMNSVQIHSVCPRCKDILEWKIKYKKYKMLKAPKTCNKCHQKTVKEPYHTACNQCAGALAICPKCAAPRIEWAKDGQTTTASSVSGDRRDGDDPVNDGDSGLENEDDGSDSDSQSDSTPS